MKTKHGFAYAIGVAQLRDALPHACMHYARGDANVDALYALVPEMYQRELQVIVATGGPNWVQKWNARWAEIYLAEVAAGRPGRGSSARRER